MTRPTIAVTIGKNHYRRMMSQAAWDALAAGCRAADYPVDPAAIDASGIRCGPPVGGELTFGDWLEPMPLPIPFESASLRGTNVNPSG